MSQDPGAQTCFRGYGRICHFISATPRRKRVREARGRRRHKGSLRPVSSEHLGASAVPPMVIHSGAGTVHENPNKRRFASYEEGRGPKIKGETHGSTADWGYHRLEVKLTHAFGLAKKALVSLILIKNVLFRAEFDREN